MNSKYTNIFLLLSTLLLFSCESNRWEVDSNEMDVSLNIQRYEQDLFKVETNNFQLAQYQELQVKYPQFSKLYMEGVMAFGSPAQPWFFEKINRFLGDENIQQLHADVSESYSELDFIEEKLSNAFGRYRHFFKGKSIPQLISFISVFSYSIVTDDSLLAIGLDNYLGADYEFYPQAGIPQYLFSHFSKEYMAADAMKAWLSTEFDSYEGTSLLEQMVHQGKILYLTQVMLPEEKRNAILRFTEEEMEWCRENEKEIWFHFVDNEILYTNENMIIKKYMGDAPFVAGFPEGSPGRVGQWMGLQIVERYMENEDEASLQDLLSKKANNLLVESKYKPKK